jgi:phosphoribosylglycinamide formyltransferase-1
VTPPLRIAWLTTARGQGSYGALEYTLDAIERALPVQIAVVFVNRDRGDFEPTDRLIAMAEARGVPVEAISSVKFRKARGAALSRAGEPLPPWRLEYDAEVAERLSRYDFSLGVMFGYMLIATEPLYSRFRFINDHPALPGGPVGTYEEVIHELIRQRATESGCLINVVTGDLDRGPVVSFCRFGIRDEANEGLWQSHERDPGGTADEELFADIRRRGVARERPFLVETLRAIAEGRLEVPPKQPVDLTRKVEKLVGAGA